MGPENEKRENRWADDKKREEKKKADEWLTQIFFFRLREQGSLC